MVQVEQNLGFCILWSAVGGTLEVLATAALAYPDAKKHQLEKWKSPWVMKGCTFVNILLQVLASVVGNLFAPWYGPVSIVGPTFLSAQLVANMVIYGYVLGLESFTKDMRIGTCVIVTAAVLLPVVGPDVQDTTDVEALFTRWYAYAWNATLVTGMGISGIILIVRWLSKNYCQLTSPITVYAVLLTARATSFVLNLSFSKVFVLEPSKEWLTLSIVLKVVSGMVMTGSIVVQSTAVAQNIFVPLNATILILTNGLNGILVWEDGKVIASWLGYVTVFLQLVVGNYLLLGEIDWFGPQNKRYGRRQLLTRLVSQGGVPPVDTKESGKDIESGLERHLSSMSTIPSFSSSEDCKSQFSNEVANTWLSSGSLEDSNGSSKSTTKAPIPRAQSLGQILSSVDTPSSSSCTKQGPDAPPPRPRALSSERCAGTTETISKESESISPRPASLSALRRSSTSSPLLNQTAIPAPPEMRRFQTTGRITNMESIRQRRNYYFGSNPAARLAWSRIYNVDPSWLDRRSSQRQMETIMERFIESDPANTGELEEGKTTE